MRQNPQLIGGLTLLALAIAPLPSFAQEPTIPKIQITPITLPIFPNSSYPLGEIRAESAYILGAGDRIRLDVVDVPEYNGEYQVLVDGSLNLPIIGGILVQGMTLQQAATEISGRYARYVKRPILTVSLLSARPLTIAIAGEINRPGAYTIPLADGRQFPTITQAIQLAGGTTQSADLRRVQVRRQQLGSPDQIIDANLWELSQNGDLRQNIVLRDGDTVFLPTVADINLAENRQLATVNFTGKITEPIKVVVVGEVFRPGPYPVSSDKAGNSGTTTSSSAGSSPPTLTRALQVAGGITPKADIRQIQIRRLARSGAEKIINVDIWQLLQTGDISQDIILQDGDTIAVPTAVAINPAEAIQIANASFSPDKIKVSVVGEVAKPGAIDVPPNTPLNQAILAAGGFNERARTTVDLIHVNENGTVSKQAIAIDFSRGINDQTNPILQRNDIVVVTPSDVAGIGDTLGLILNPFLRGLGFLNIFGIFR